MINIFEYHFIVIRCDMIEGNKYTTQRYSVTSDRDYGAWSQCIALALRDCKGHESLYKIELIEVE